MANKFLSILLIPFLITSCITIKRVADVPAQPSFSTATLVLPTPKWTPAVFAVPTETATFTPVITAIANCSNAAVLLRDVTIPDFSQVNAGETFTKTWEFQNTGTCPWANYTVKFTSGDDVHAPLSTTYLLPLRRKRCKSRWS